MGGREEKERSEMNKEPWRVVVMYRPVLRVSGFDEREGGES